MEYCSISASGKNVGTGCANQSKFTYIVAASDALDIIVGTGGAARRNIVERDIIFLGNIWRVSFRMQYSFYDFSENCMFRLVLFDPFVGMLALLLFAWDMF